LILSSGRGDAVAHVTEFTVEGLAGRTDPLSGELGRHTNVFFGLNGSGKTSLLKILHSAMAGDATSLQKVPFTRAEVKIYSISHEQVFTRTCVKESQADVPSAEEAPGISAAASAILAGHTAEPKEPKLKWDQIPLKDPPASNAWNHRYLPTTRLYLADRLAYAGAAQYAMHGAVVLNEDLLEESFADLMNKIWTIYSATILGVIQRAQADGLADILKAILSGGHGLREGGQLDPEAAYERVARFLRRQGSPAILGDFERFQANYVKNPQLRSVVGDINNVEARIQEAVTPRDRLQSTIQAMFSGNKKVVFTDASIEISVGNDAKIGLSRLSSGEKQLLRILIDSLLADKNAVILDEPEISLHVDWQKILIPTMRQLSPEAQLIIATHSPEIMEEVDDENIFRI
jgi:energy-coupling factor transporter ATP-binding protein EcfA2